MSDKSNSLRLYELIIIYCYKTEWKHRINENEISSDPGTKIDNLPSVKSVNNKIQIICAIGVNAWYIGNREMPAVVKRAPSADEMWEKYMNSMAATNSILN